MKKTKKHASPDAPSDGPMLAPHSCFLPLQTVNVTEHDERKFFSFNGVRFVYQNDTKDFKPHDFEQEAIVRAYSRLEKKGDRGLSSVERRAVLGENKIETEKFGWFSGIYLVSTEPLLFTLLFVTFGLPMFPLRAFDAIHILALFSCIVFAVLVIGRRNRFSKAFSEENIGSVEVLRQDQWQWISAEQLLPGDIFRVVERAEIFCDAVLISRHCIVQESCLTGESYPSEKRALSAPRAASGQLHLEPHHRLYAGSMVMLAPSKTFAVVTEIGSRTCKGQLAQVAFRFGERVMRFKASLYKFFAISCMASLTYLFTRCIQVSTHAFPNTVSSSVRFVSTIYYFFQELITRDAYMLVSHITMYLQAWFAARELVCRYLKKSEIDCHLVRALPVAGHVDCMVFDKSGTITDGNLCLKSILPVEHKMVDWEYYDDPSYGTDLDVMVSRFAQPVPVHIQTHEDWNYDSDHCWTNVLSPEWRAALASCHAISRDESGEIDGNSVDIALFNATKWQLSDEDDQGLHIFNPPQMQSVSSKRIEVMRNLQFDAKTLTSGVIINHGGDCFLFVKGAVESLIEQCDVSSVPYGVIDLARAESRETNYVQQ